MRNKKMAKVYYFILVFIVCIAVVCQCAYVNISAHCIIDDYDENSNIHLYSYNDYFILEESDNTKTVIMRLSANGKDKDTLFENYYSPESDIDFEYVCSAACNNSIYLAYNCIYNKSVEPRSVLKIYKFNFNAYDAPKSIDIENARLAGSNCFSVSADGSIFVILDNLRTNLQVIRGFTANGIESLLTTESSIECIKCDPAGEKLYLSFDDKLGYYDLTQSQNELFYYDRVPDGDYNFIDNNTIIDSNACIYRLENNKLNYSFSTLSNYDNIRAARDNDGNIINQMSSNLLYCFEKDTNLVIGEHAIDGRILDFCSNEDSTLIISADDGKVYAETLLLSDISAKEINDNIIYEDKDSIVNDFNNSRPKNKDSSKIFLTKADTDEFSTCGVVSDTVLNDGLKAINFYRELYGLDNVTLSDSLVDLSQHASVLALCNYDIDNPKKPEGMSDSFYRKAVSVYDKNCTYIFSDTYPSPISKTIDYLYSTNEYFRAYILNENMSEIGFGCAADNNGNNSVVIGIDREAGYENLENNFVFYPSVNYPSNLVKHDQDWCVYLNPDKYGAGARGKVEVAIDGCVLDPDKVKLSMDNTCIKFACPEFESESSYKIVINNLYDTDGNAAILKYEVNLFEISVDNNDENADNVSSDIYYMDKESKIITGIAPSTTVSTFKSNINYDDYNIKILNYKNKEITSGTIGTSAKVIFTSKDSGASYEYTLVVYGDITGEGNVNNHDLRVLYKYLLGLQNLGDYFKMAADINHDGIIDTLDLLLMKNYIDGISDIDQYYGVNKNLL